MDFLSAQLNFKTKGISFFSTASVGRFARWFAFAWLDAILFWVDPFVCSSIIIVGTGIGWGQSWFDGWDRLRFVLLVGRWFVCSCIILKVRGYRRGGKGSFCWEGGDFRAVS